MTLKNKNKTFKDRNRKLNLACYISFMTHISRPNTIMLITVVLSSKLNLNKKRKKRPVVKDCSGVSRRKNLVTVNE